VLTGANKGRLAGQQGVAAASTVKTALTVAALGTTAYARVLGKKLERAGDVPWRAAQPQIPLPRGCGPRSAAAHRAAVGDPGLTGAMLVVNARMGEQQRLTQVTGGLVRRLLPGR
jgi:hypothetical protein